MAASTNNLLDKVVDATTAAASSYSNDLDETQANGNYAYDAIGNLTKDTQSGIAANGIVWTPYGKIKQVTNATYRIEYLYDAMGNRVRQKRTKLLDNTYVTTYYGRDASGKNVVGTYEKVGTGSTILKEVPLYGSSRLGILRPNATQSTTPVTPPTVYTRTLGKKEYELTDHLGNVRVSVSDRLVKPGTDWRNDVKTQTDYFPFGMQREDRNDNVAGYRYGYNGKENDNDVKGEGNQQDYGFRIYDPRVARWLSMDPLMKKYPSTSPYVYALNTPIQAKDPDGRLVIFVNGYRGPGSDILDPIGLGRAIGDAILTEQIYRNDHYSYWGNMDDKFMERIGDHNAVYADASSHALSDAGYRKERGVEAGQELLKMIRAGDIVVKPGETIKVVAHSQGSAYAAGMEEVLGMAGYKVEVSYNIATKQPNDIGVWARNLMRIVQYSSPDDFIAPQSKMSGKVELRDDIVPIDKRGMSTGGGHTIDAYHDTNSSSAGNDKSGIFNIPENKPGAVLPRQDKP